MQMTHALLAIGVALALGAMSPGPSFLMVARTSIAQSRLHGVAAAFGMGAGGVLFGGLALLGVHLVFGAVPWVYLAVKLMGGAYLIFLGYVIWRDASTPLNAVSDTAMHKR